MLEQVEHLLKRADKAIQLTRVDVSNAGKCIANALALVELRKKELSSMEEHARIIEDYLNTRRCDAANRPLAAQQQHSELAWASLIKLKGILAEAAPSDVATAIKVR